MVSSEIPLCVVGRQSLGSLLSEAKWLSGLTILIMEVGAHTALTVGVGAHTALTGNWGSHSPDGGRRGTWRASCLVAQSELTSASIHRETMRVTTLSSTTGK